MADDLATYGGAVLDRLSELPGGPLLIEVAQESGNRVCLVGGAVRDLLLGQLLRELDAVVEGDAGAIAEELAARLGGEVTGHDRFGTASVRGPEVRLDLASARSEVYDAPGALPQVRPATVEEDLQRRDFTVNAIAVDLAGAAPGALHAVRHAIGDLNAGRLRVLHDASFSDDPTRLLRLARYAARLDFEVEQHTSELTAEAVAAGALSTVSGARVGAELRLALDEPDPVAALAQLDRLGLLGALDPRLRLDQPTVTAAQELLPPEGRHDLLTLAALALGVPASELRAWLDRLEFCAGDRDLVAAAVATVPTLSHALAQADRPSELRAAVGDASVEAIALAGALGPTNTARRWLAELRHVRLAITGHDLLAAGVPEGPDVGRRLQHALDLRLDGELGPGARAELDAALGN